MGITTWKSSIWLFRVLYALYSLRRAGSFLHRIENASIFSFMSPERGEYSDRERDKGRDGEVVGKEIGGRVR